MSLENFQKIYRTNVIDVVNYLRDKTGYFLVSDNSEIRSEIKITLFYKGMCQVSWISEEIIKGKRKPLSLKEFDQEKKILNTLRNFRDTNINPCIEPLNKLIECLEKSIDEPIVCRPFNNDSDQGYEEPGIIYDVLGVYIYNEFDEKDKKNYFSSEIEIYCDKIEQISPSFRVSEKLFLAVLIHELAHAFHHIGIDRKDKICFAFQQMDRSVKEGYANYCTHYFRKNNLKFNWSDYNAIFKKHTCQSGPYKKYLDWISSDYSFECLGSANTDFRNDHLLRSVLEFDKRLMDYKSKGH